MSGHQTDVVHYKIYFYNALIIVWTDFCLTHTGDKDRMRIQNSAAHHKCSDSVFLSYLKVTEIYVEMIEYYGQCSIVKNTIKEKHCIYFLCSQMM